MDVGKLDRDPLREVWPHEARDFATCLERNLEDLGKALGHMLTPGERIKAVGPFWVDLVLPGGRFIAGLRGDDDPTLPPRHADLARRIPNLDGSPVTWYLNLANPEEPPPWGSLWPSWAGLSGY
jgi:hypothetical protein